MVRIARCSKSVAIACLVWSAAVLLARAQAPAPIQLSWEAARDCPDLRDAQRALDELMEGGGQTARGPTFVAVKVARSSARYAAEIVFSGVVHGKRSLMAASCRALTDAAVLIIAITIDPLAVASHLTVNRQLPPRSTDSVRFELALRLSADIGSLPQFTIGPSVEAGFALGRFRAALEGTYWVPRVKLLERDNGVRGEIALWEAGVRSCFELLRTASLSMGPCAAFSGGTSSGIGQNLRVSNEPPAAAPWAAARLGASLRRYSGALFIDVEIDVGLTLVTPVYLIDDAEFFRTGPWFGRATLGVGVRL